MNIHHSSVSALPQDMRGEPFELIWPIFIHLLSDVVCITLTLSQGTR